MKRTKEESLITREQLLDAALVVFLKKGYAATTIIDIVTEAGYTRGAFYWHFKSKEELLDQLLKREDDFINELINNLLETDLQALHKIEHILLNIIENFYENLRFRRFIEFTWFKIEQKLEDKSIHYKASLNKIVIEKLNELLDKAIQLNELKDDLNAKTISLQIITMINGIYRLYFLLPAHFNQKGTSKKLITNYINLLKNQ